MTFKQKIAGYIMAALALLGIGTQVPLGGLSDATQKFSTIGAMGTSGAMILVANTSAQVAATSSGREILRISNLGSNPIYCNADQDKAAVVYTGITVYASSTLTFDQQFPYTGAVRCISPFGNSSTTVYAK